MRRDMRVELDGGLLRSPRTSMIVHWILLLLLAPGWLLPSGVSVPLCGCQFAPSETRSCCAPVERHACCAGDDESESTGKSVERERECHCSVDAPTHEPARVQPQTETAALFALPLAPVELAIVASEPTITRVLRPDRPRGPSPGRPNPAPLRL